MPRNVISLCNSCSVAVDHIIPSIPRTKILETTQQDETRQRKFEFKSVLNSKPQSRGADQVEWRHCISRFTCVRLKLLLLENFSVERDCNLLLRVARLNQEVLESPWQAMRKKLSHSGMMLELFTSSEQFVQPIVISHLTLNSISCFVQMQIGEAIFCMYSASISSFSASDNHSTCISIHFSTWKRDT